MTSHCWLSRVTEHFGHIRPPPAIHGYTGLSTVEVTTGSSHNLPPTSLRVPACPPSPPRISSAASSTPPQRPRLLRLRYPSPPGAPVDQRQADQSAAAQVSASHSVTSKPPVSFTDAVWLGVGSVPFPPQPLKPPVTNTATSATPAIDLFTAPPSVQNLIPLTLTTPEQPCRNNQQPVDNQPHGSLSLMESTELAPGTSPRPSMTHPSE